MEFLSAYTKANSANLLHQSVVPEICKTAPCSLGIDEAGRGPVLGPMVYACAYCPVDKTDDLKAIGVDDSKALTEEQREKMFGGIVSNSDFVGWAVHILAPQYISTSMYKRGKYNLNRYE
jgi:ribonuclease H2 subunit A